MAAGDFPFPVEEAFLELIEAEFPALTLLDHEPRQMEGDAELPALTLFWSDVDDQELETGPKTDATWGWEVRLYCDVSEQGWEAGQRELRTLVPLLLLAVRKDKSLGDTCSHARLGDPGGQPEIDDNEGLIWKSLRLTVRTEETT